MINYSQLSPGGGALASPWWLELLDVLAQGKRSVEASYQAVEILRASRRAARRLVDGFPEWRAEGLPVDVSAAEGSR
jgi:hypothetical protein